VCHYRLSDAASEWLNGVNDDKIILGRRNAAKATEKASTSMQQALGEDLLHSTVVSCSGLRILSATSGIELEPAPLTRHEARHPAEWAACEAKVMRFSQEHVQTHNIAGDLF